VKEQEAAGARAALPERRAGCWGRAQVAERLVCCHGEAAARALVALLEDEWRQLKALRRRFAGDTPGSILKRRSPGSPRARAPGLPRLGCSC